MSLWPSPWPAEDGGPDRRQIPNGSAGLGLADGEHLAVTSRDALASTMCVLRDPGELFLLRHSLGPRGADGPVETWVERIDPLTLEPLASSPRLAAGPFWPGGLVAHSNGSLYVTAGSWCHRLSSDLRVLGAHELARARPYNSLVVLACGALVMKDLDRSASTRTTLTVLDPETLRPLCPPQEAPEASIARLSAVGDTVYLVGAHTISRWDWDGGRLVRDESWELRYRTQPDQSYGWDVALAGGHAWFMDNGDHDFVTTMLGAGKAPRTGSPRARVAHRRERPRAGAGLRRAGRLDHQPAAVRRAAAGGGRLRLGQRGAGRVQVRGRPPRAALAAPLASAGHLLLFPETGELVAYDFHPSPGARTRLARSAGKRGARLVLSRRLRRMAARLAHEDVLVLDVGTGVERGRASVPSLFQSVLFPCPGWDRDVVLLLVLHGRPRSGHAVTSG